MEERTETWMDIFCKMKIEIINHPIKHIDVCISIISIQQGGCTIGDLIGESVGFRCTGAIIGALIGYTGSLIMMKKIVNLGEKTENYILNFSL